MTPIYIRPLVLADAKTSFNWRNDPEVWEYTEYQPDLYISPELEEEWLKAKLSRVNEKRFAICLEENDQYIGNIQLLDIDGEKASYHIFIGEKSFWGRGISQSATKLILAYAFSELNLENVSLEVNPLNVPAWKAYQKVGFESIGENKKNGFMKMAISKNEFLTIL
ncbi:GNAT family N-acetyltransferase [Pedobacter hiemivivus]|uniref:N-acetyltransferase n=1 Tax=Pedobacter hiemivivus TaxID=2530454 RepID=A0A4R0MZA6_9SPHI|nr:GNAT family protein [Pedobacter hiemivivus]TCC92709.1 N-acetyltransferase [Pedobacter hiemivivus]TKC56223.1 GNAT family N-acetyltransferase [Pedobacter hiemivivus]